MDQLAIALFGVTAVFLSQSADANQRRYSCLFGLLGQPFWFYAAVASKQWGILLLCVVYTAVWAYGFWQHWISPKRRKQ